MLDVAGSETAGVDEVGRGPLAGPVVAAAVILGPDHGISGLRDSKCLKPARREALALQIRRQARAWCISYVSAWEIDRLNILQASLLAMHRAVQRLPVQPLRVLVDGNRAPVWPYACETVIGGDDRVDAIAAASILAKTARDSQMLALAACYPGYGFERHMGYPTPAHKAALQHLGPCPAHRHSFAPVRACQAANHHQPDGSGKLA